MTILDRRLKSIMTIHEIILALYKSHDINKEKCILFSILNFYPKLVVSVHILGIYYIQEDNILEVCENCVFLDSWVKCLVDNSRGLHNDFHRMAGSCDYNTKLLITFQKLFLCICKYLFLAPISRSLSRP
jgi:hypothetical protein